MTQFQPSRALTLGRTKISHRWEVDLRGNASLQQMEQRRDRGGRESHERQRMYEAHVNKRSARPNGMLVCT